jgi:hypothetical protein
VRTRSARVGWGLLALGLVGHAAGVVLWMVNGSLLQNSGEDIALTLAFGSFLVVGCVLVARRPDNRIGWIFTAVGLLTTAAILAQGYTTYAYVTHPGSLPGRLFAAWVFTWIWLPIGMLTVVFPQLASHRTNSRTSASTAGDARNRNRAPVGVRRPSISAWPARRRSWLACPMMLAASLEQTSMGPLPSRPLMPLSFLSHGSQ